MSLGLKELNVAYDSLQICFSACSVQINSEKNHRGDALHVVDRLKTKEYPVNLTNDKSCQVDTTASKYQKCGEEWQTFSAGGSHTGFSLLGDTNKGYKLKVQCAADHLIILIFKPLICPQLLLERLNLGLFLFAGTKKRSKLKLQKNIYLIGDFRVAFLLCFKVSPSAKPFIIMEISFIHM